MQPPILLIDLQPMAEQLWLSYLRVPIMSQLQQPMPHLFHPSPWALQGELSCSRADYNQLSLVPVRLAMTHLQLVHDA